MKKLLTIALIAGLAFSCNNKKNADVPADSPIVADSNHNAQTSLDYEGIYKGILPCADCDSIVVILSLTDQSNYTISSESFKNGEHSKMEGNGTYSWNDAGNTITLSDEKDKPNQYFVAENQLIQLDMNGNRITGGLADMYILKKQ